MSETLIDEEFPGEDQEVEQKNVERIIYEVEEDSSALDVQDVKRGDYSKLDEVAAEDVLMDALNEFTQRHDLDEKVLQTPNVSPSIKGLMVPVEYITVPEFKKNSRDPNGTLQGLTKQVQSMSTVVPVVLTLTEAYYKHLMSDKPVDEFMGQRFVLLQGLRRLFATLRVKAKTIPAVVQVFDNPEVINKRLDILSSVLQRSAKPNWAETYELVQRLADDHGFEYHEIDTLVGLGVGDALKLDDVMKDEKYPEVKDTLEKKDLKSAYALLEKFRREDATLAAQDSVGLQDMDGQVDYGMQIQEGVQVSSQEEVTEALGYLPQDEDEDSESAQLEVSAAVRDAVLEREDGQCWACGLGEFLESEVFRQTLQVFPVSSSLVQSDVDAQQVWQVQSEDVPAVLPLCLSCFALMSIWAKTHDTGIAPEESVSVPEDDRERFGKLWVLAQLSDGSLGFERSIPVDDVVEDESQEPVSAAWEDSDESEDLGESSTWEDEDSDSEEESESSGWVFDDEDEDESEYEYDPAEDEDENEEYTV